MKRAKDKPEEEKYCWFPATLWFRETRRMKLAERGRYMSRSMIAVMEGKYGVTPLADAIMAETKRRRGGSSAHKKGVKA
jgi:hypothetical protein